MTEKILYRVLCDEYEEVARIFFEIKETGEQIEGSHQIQKWINNVFNENEQLKSTINTLTHDNTKMKKVLNTTKNENEQIKHLIKEAYNNERTKLGQSVLKQLLETIQ